MQITVKKIHKLSLLKIYTVGLSIPLGLFGLGCGIAALFGSSTVSINGVQATGWGGLFSGILLGIALSVGLTLFVWLLSLFGLWAYSWFAALTLGFQETNRKNNTTRPDKAV